MRKKYYIFVLTFLCLLCGQMGYAGDIYVRESDDVCTDEFTDLVESSDCYDLYYTQGSTYYCENSEHIEYYGYDVYVDKGCGGIDSGDCTDPNSSAYPCQSNDSNDPCDDSSYAYDPIICYGYGDGSYGGGGSGGGVSSSLATSINCIRNYVVNHQSSLLGLANNLKQTGTYVQIGGLSLAAIGLFTTGGAATAPGISIAIAGGYTEATGIVLQILIEFTVNGNSNEFGQFFISKSIDYGLGSLLPGPNPDMSPLINDAIEIINEAILLSGGNTIPN